MTHPPQPGQPYGQQPDPYGQSGQPQSGGLPQQPCQPYPSQQYPQQGGYDPSGGYGQQHQYPGYDHQQYPQTYGQGFGGPPAPPKEGKTGLWIGIAASALAVIVVAITGFVAPGFFLQGEFGIRWT